MSNENLTDSQVASMNALLIVKGWADVGHLEKHGANPSSLLNLVKRGMADKRTSVSVKGFDFLEFRRSDGWFTNDELLKPEKCSTAH